MRCKDCSCFERLGMSSGFCYHIAQLVDGSEKACDHPRYCSEIHCECKDVDTFTEKELEARYNEAVKSAY